MTFTFQSFCSDKQKQLIQTGTASALRAACDTQSRVLKLYFSKASCSISVCWGSFRPHSGHRVTSCYHQTAGHCKVLNIQKDQILLGCFAVCFSPSFPAVYTFILAEWGPCGGRNLECCGNLFQTVRKNLSTKL